MFSNYDDVVHVHDPEHKWKGRLSDLPAAAAPMVLLATNWLDPDLASQWALVIKGFLLAVSHKEFMAIIWKVGTRKQLYSKMVLVL